MRITGLDHIVLNVADVRRSLDFYVGTLGLEPMQVEEWEAGQAFFPSVRIDAGTIIDLLQQGSTGHNVDHVCLVVEDDVETLAARDDLVVEEGPCVRSGARGDGLSIYVRDPDGNLLELKNYR
jgi:catechol 2,3-dioxygenase-like lactoylglutathione lyase family enzyme